MAYALFKLYAIPKRLQPRDAGHHGWLGWDSPTSVRSADLFCLDR